MQKVLLPLLFFKEKKYFRRSDQKHGMKPQTWEILYSHTIMEDKVMQGKVEICGVNTAELKTLKSEEMIPLLKKAQGGDEEARQKLIEGNLRLVLSVIQKFMGRNENPDDLFQVGCIGLLKAIAGKTGSASG